MTILKKFLCGRSSEEDYARGWKLERLSEGFAVWLARESRVHAKLILNLHVAERERTIWRYGCRLKFI